MGSLPALGESSEGIGGECDQVWELARYRRQASLTHLIFSGREIAISL
jgi:hypothetical protein